MRRACHAVRYALIVVTLTLAGAAIRHDEVARRSGQCDVIRVPAVSDGGLDRR